MTIEVLARLGPAAEPQTQSGLKRVRCPKCEWRPGEASVWSCTPVGHPEYYEHGACGHTWNTFGTRGKCPGCRHQWRNTLCLSCWEFSPHKDWYETPGARSSTP